MYDDGWAIFTPRSLVLRLYPPSWIRKIGGKKPSFSTNILSTRGWALQESVLPNRILHFTGQGMAWECNHCCIGEDFNLKKLTFRALRAIKLAKLTLKPLVS